MILQWVCVFVCVTVNTREFIHIRIKFSFEFNARYLFCLENNEEMEEQ